MPRTTDPGDQLIRMLTRAAAACGIGLDVTMATATAWASATFSGARHMLDVTAADTPALAGWLAELSESDFVLRGHLLADLVVDAVARRDGTATITIAALTLEDQ